MMILKKGRFFCSLPPPREFLINQKEKAAHLEAVDTNEEAKFVNKLNLFSSLTSLAGSGILLYGATNGLWPNLHVPGLQSATLLHVVNISMGAGTSTGILHSSNEPKMDIEESTFSMILQLSYAGVAIATYFLMKHLIYKEGNDSMTNWEENEIKEFLQIKENEKKERKSDFLATSGFTFLYIAFLCLDFFAFKGKIIPKSILKGKLIAFPINILGTLLYTAAYTKIYPSVPEDFFFVKLFKIIDSKGKKA